MREVPKRVWARTAQLTRYGIDWRSLAVTLFQVDSQISHDMSDCTAYVVEADLLAERALNYDLVEALRTAKQAMDSTFLPGGHGDGSLPAFADNHPAMRQICATLAKAEAREKGDG